MFSHIKEFFTRPSGYSISRSVRLRSSASAYLSRTQTSGNRKTYTYSAWVKRGNLASKQNLFGTVVYPTPSNYQSYWSFLSDNTFEITFYSGSSYLGQLITTQVFRDPSAWYHIVVQVDTTQATSSNRVKLFVNGTQVTSFSTTNYPAQNTDTFINTDTYQVGIGRVAPYVSGEYFDGYLTEINFIDGQALTPSSFGETDSITGVWKAKKYSGTYGTNGFYLNFSDNSSNTATTIGKDYSGNGNNWTPNNISVTAGATYDSMLDSPTMSAVSSNYAVLNPLDKATSFTTADGNLSFTPANTSDLYSCRSTIQIPSTGKWIWQVTNTNSAYMITAGLLNGSTALTAQQTVSCAGMTVGSIGTFFSTTQWMNTTTSWSVTNIGNGDTLVIAYDADAGKIWFGRVASGGTTVTWYNTSGTADPSTGTDPRASGITAGGWFAGFGTYYTPSGASANFGQRPFAFTNIPTGFVALNTWNLPDSTIKNGAGYMAATLYTGAGGTQTITNTVNGVGFQPDFVWGKARSVTYSNALFDSVRGFGSAKGLLSNATQAEGTTSAQYGYVSTNTSTGFTATGGTDVSNPNAALNESGVTYVAWQWKAGGTSSSNTNGSITSTVSVGATQGFSVVTWTGTTASSATIGHGLGVAPSMIIVKNRSRASTYWCVYTTTTGNTKALNLNDTSTGITDIGFWNNTNPTSSVFTTGNGYAYYVGGTTDNYVAYCFAAVKGFSAFGSYTGNGSTDGPFVYTGFRPRFIMYKRTDGINNWSIRDSNRDGYNSANGFLQPNTSNTEYSGSTYPVDLLSNGFKIRTTDSNESGGNFIWAAFAENPFKNSLAR